jgi:hypothetical protein
MNVPLRFVRVASAGYRHLHLQHVLRHQLEANEFNDLQRLRFIIVARSFNVKYLSHQFEGEGRRCWRAIWTTRNY